jgi:alpha-glucosidase
MLLFTLPGTLTMYYGEEIGMTNVPIAPEQVQDPAEKNEPGIGQGRDPERTPMRWDATQLAGFTMGIPWLPIGGDQSINVATEHQDDGSIFALYRKLIGMRKSHPILVSGKLNELHIENDILHYRRSGSEEIQIILNMTHEEKTVQTLPATVVVGTRIGREGQTVNGLSTLQPAEGLVLLLS